MELIRGIIYVNPNNARIGEKNGMTTHSETLIRKICEGLEMKLPIKETCTYAGLEYNEENRKYVSRIKRKDIWTHISNQYDIPEESYAVKSKFTNEEAHQICRMIESGYSDYDRVDFLRPNLEKKERMLFKNTVYKIRNHLTFKHISMNYNF